MSFTYDKPVYAIHNAICLRVLISQEVNNNLAFVLALTVTGLLVLIIISPGVGAGDQVWSLVHQRARGP